MKEIGGYLSLEIPNTGEYHNEVIKLNSGRNCLKVIIKEREIKEIFIPYYTCESVVDVCLKNVESVVFYKINKAFEIENLKDLTANSYILVNNYFGIKESYIKSLSTKFNKLIIDNSQAFFAKPIMDLDTFYSPRKFFGLPDGGYLYTNLKLEDDYKIGKSLARMSHLLKRIELGAQEGYIDFIENDNSIDNEPVHKMSSITESLLNGIQYEKILNRRNRNYRCLDNSLKHLNELKFDTPISGALIYPFYTEVNGLREYLISKKIYIAKYWPNIDNWTPSHFFDNKLSDCIIPLPIDQRYNTCEMDYIAGLITKFLSHV
jgi:hypothetical protein